MNYRLSIVIGLISGFATLTVSNSQETLVPTASFLGTRSSERVGYYVHTAGDVNRDGYDDFLIGTFHNKTMGYDAGAAYLILGKKEADWGFNKSLALADARFLGGTSYDAVGYCLGGGGDVNGDSYDDVLIGAPAGNDLVPENHGHVYIVFGKAVPDWGADFILPSSADASFDGENDHDIAGLSVAMIGDMNNDGYDDFICGAPNNDYGATDAGKAYLILGKPTGWSQGINLSEADASFYDSSSRAFVGYSVEGVGDVNGDDIPDIAIGALNRNKVFLIFGRQNVNWGCNYNINFADVIFSGEQFGDYTGWRISRAGDVNGDGLDDFLIGAPLYDTNKIDAGKVYLILGRNSGWTGDLSQADASYLGEAENDQAGWDVHNAGDVNGDGYDDFLIGALLKDSHGQDRGKMYLIKGKASGWQQNVSLSQIEDYFIGEHPGDYAGLSVSCAGDVNGDHWSDIITSSPFNNDAYSWGGKIYLIVSHRDKFCISGNIRYYNLSSPISNTQIMIKGQPTLLDTTDLNGNYKCLDLAEKNYVVRPKKEHDVDNAVSAFDAAWILQYNVGLRSFTPYQMIAGDVTGNGNVSAYDAAMILRYDVELINKFPVMIDTTHYWRFVPEDFAITPTNWTTAPDSIAYTPLNSDTTDNYYGIIYGDVSGTWQPSGPALASLNKSSAGTTDIRLDDIYGEANEKVILPVILENGSDIVAMSFTLEYDSEVLKALSAATTMNTEGWQIAYNIKENLIKVALAGSKPITMSGAIVNLEFEVIKTESSGANSALNISKIMINEGNIAVNVPSAKFTRGTPVPKEYALYQNYPNPFNPETVIKYQLPQPVTVILKVYNTIGQEVRTLVNEEKKAGYHEVSWDGTDDKGLRVTTGVYIYQLHVGDFLCSRKMIFMM